MEETSGIEETSGAKRMSEKTKKIWLSIAAGAIIVAFGVLITLMVIRSQPIMAEPENNEGKLIGETKDKFMVSYNLDLLTLAYNIKISTIVAEDIENYIFLPEQMRFSGENKPTEKDGKVYYDAVLDASTFSSFDVYTSGFEMTISDGRVYWVFVRTDSLDDDFKYVYVAIMREESDTFKLYVNGDGVDKEEFVKFVEEKTGAKEEREQ